VGDPGDDGAADAGDDGDVENRDQRSENRKANAVAEMIRFRYGGYWDVPRFIHLTYRGRSLLLLSPFDEEIDEYPEHYTVFEVPADVESGSELKWWGEGLSNGREDFVATGTLAIKDVRFDSLPGPEMLDPSALDGIVLPQRVAKKETDAVR
jgi:hypothetical protein